MHLDIPPGRNDDVAPKSAIETLQAVNQVHVDENVPVTLAIIPHPAAQGSDAQLFRDGQPVLFGPSFPEAPVNELRQELAFFDYNCPTATRSSSSRSTGTPIRMTVTPGSSNKSEFAESPLTYSTARYGRDGTTSRTCSG